MDYRHGNFEKPAPGKCGIPCSFLPPYSAGHNREIKSIIFRTKTDILFPNMVAVK